MSFIQIKPFPPLAVNQFHQCLNMCLVILTSPVTDHNQTKASYCYSSQWGKSAETREDCEEFQKDLKIPSKGNSTLKR